MASNNIVELNVDQMTMEELKIKLEELSQSVTESKAILSERLKGVLEENEEDEGDYLTSAQINKMSKADLVNQLHELSLKVSGNKHELKMQLKATLEIKDDDTDEEDSQNGDSKAGSHAGVSEEDNDGEIEQQNL